MNHRFDSLVMLVELSPMCINAKKNSMDNFYKIFKEKFAEAIIKECAAVADNYPSDSKIYPSQFIKNHFGLE